MTGFTRHHCPPTYRLRHGSQWANRIVFCCWNGWPLPSSVLPGFPLFFFAGLPCFLLSEVCCTYLVFLVLTSRLVPVIGRAADLRDCLSRCGRLGWCSCSLAFTLMGLGRWSLCCRSPSRCVEAWHCMAILFVAELGIGCCHKGTPGVIVAMNTYFGQSAHFCFSVAKFGTAKPMGFYGTLRSHKGFQQIFLFLPASTLCVFASG